MKRLWRIAKWSVFIGYCFLLIYILFLYQRHSFYQMTYWEYIQRSINLIPFNTIRKYIHSVNSGTINIKTVIANLFGNFILFMPFGLFLPTLFDVMKKPLRYLATIFSIVFAIEIMQIIFQVGAFDIDDFILNIAGSMFAFIIYNYSVLKFIKTQKEEK